MTGFRPEPDSEPNSGTALLKLSNSYILVSMISHCEFTIF